MTRFRFRRRTALKLGGAAAAACALRSVNLRAQAQERRFLFVICAQGGANIIDSFLALLQFFRKIINLFYILVS